MKRLTQSAINSFLKSEKTKISDAEVRGLRLIKKSKKISWYFRYKKLGTKKDTEIKIGDYPDVSLSTAREIARSYNELLTKGIDPQEYKRAEEERLKREAEKKTFKEVAYEFLELQRLNVSEARFKKNYMRAFEKYAIPFMGYKKIDEITRYDLIEFIKWIPKQKLSNATKKTNKTYTAKEVFNYVKNCLDYALNNGYIKYNHAYGIDPSKILPKEEKSEMKAIIDEKAIQEVYQKILNYDNLEARYIMQFQALTALRNVGIYRLKWDWIDWNKKIIVYPSNTYKANKKEFVLPLTDTLIEILQYFKETRDGKYVFLKDNTKEETMSNFLERHHKKLGIKNHTPHGWRATFRSLARKLNLGDVEALEIHLNHKISNDLGYMREKLIDKRREIMEKWELFLLGKYPY